MRKRPYAVGFFFAVLFGVGILSWIVLRPFFEAMAWAIVLAVAFRAPWLALSRRLPKSPNLAAAVASVTIGLGVLLPAAVLGVVLFGQASDAMGRLSGIVRTQNITSVSDLVALPSVARLLERVQEWSGVSSGDL